MKEGYDGPELGSHSARGRKRGRGAEQGLRAGGRAEARRRRRMTGAVSISEEEGQPVGRMTGETGHTHYTSGMEGS